MCTFATSAKVANRDVQSDTKRYRVRFPPKKKKRKVANSANQTNSKAFSFFFLSFFFFGAFLDVVCMVCERIDWLMGFG